MSSLYPRRRTSSGRRASVDDVVIPTIAKTNEYVVYQVGTFTVGKKNVKPLELGVLVYNEDDGPPINVGMSN